MPCYLVVDPPEPKEIEADRVQGQFARWAVQNYGLEVVASGGGMMDQIKVLTLWFDSRQRMSIPETRLLLVALIREFVRQINADEGIRPYLDKYPVTAENVEVKVSFVNSRDNWFALPFVAFAYWGHRKVIEYVQVKYSDVREGCEGNWRNAVFQDGRRETWQEAVQLVEQGNREKTDS